MDLSSLIISYATDDRHALMRMVESNGGTFSTRLEQDVCSHLVCLRPEGDKFEAARTWRGVRIVTRQWVEDCVSQQTWLSEGDYPVLSPTFAIPQAPRQRTSHREAITLRRKALAVSVGKIHSRAAPTNNTPAPSGPSSSAVSEAARRSEEADAFLRRALDKARSVCGMSVPEDPTSPHALEGGFLGLSHWFEDQSWTQRANPFDGDVFLGDVFFVAGFSPQAIMLITQLLLLGGGSRHHMLTENVTRVVVGPLARNRLRQSIKTHPRGAVPVKLSWLLRCVLRCLDDDTLASLQQYPERVARQSDGSSGDVTTSGSDIGAANTAQSGRHGSQKAAAAAGVGTGESARPHMPTGSSEEGLEDTRGGEEVGGTEDVIALLLSTDEARRAGKKSGATAGGRSLVTGGWPVVPAAPSDTGAGAVLGGILVPGTTGSVLNKRRRAQRQEQLLQEARRRRGGVMALDDSQPPPESEVVVYEPDTMLECGDDW